MTKPLSLTQTIELDSLGATAAFARDFALTLRAGDVVALEGDLGAGKTTLVRAIVDAMGGDPTQVSSPTFVLQHEYSTPNLRVFHLDAYRIDASQLQAIGFEELLKEGGVTLIEWPGKVASAIPADARYLRLSVTGESARRVEVFAP